VWAYAKAKGLNPQTFNKWTKKEAGKRGFVEITGKIKGKAPNIPEILIEKGDVKIHLPLTISRDDLKNVITILGDES
jgi:hypothetical protein